MVQLPQSLRKQLDCTSLISKLWSIPQSDYRLHQEMVDGARHHQVHQHHILKTPVKHERIWERCMEMLLVVTICVQIERLTVHHECQATYHLHQAVEATASKINGVSHDGY